MVVDAVNGMSTLDIHEEAVKQVAVADRIVLTKSNIENKPNRHSIELNTRLQRHNPSTQIFDNECDNPGIAELFNCGLYDPSTKTVDVVKWLDQQAFVNHDGHHNHDINRHDKRIRAFTLISQNAVGAASLATFIDLLRSVHGPNLLRVKGIIRIVEDPDRPVVIHGVQQIFHPPATLPHWPNDDHRTRLVMITRDMSQSYVRKLFNAFTGETQIDTADQLAVEKNPLAIPGVNFSG